MNNKYPSSKIKNTLIELHNYYYSNNSNEDFEYNDSFIGRNDLQNSLKSLLTNCQSKNGSYLITGYRGIGKTSFVNKVLCEINFNKAIKDSDSRYLRISFFLILLSFVRFDLYSDNFFTIFFSVIILFILGFSYLYLNRNLNSKIVRRVSRSYLIKNICIGIVFSTFTYFIFSLEFNIANLILLFILVCFITYSSLTLREKTNKKNRKNILNLFNINNVELINSKFQFIIHDFFLVSLIFIISKFVENFKSQNTFSYKPTNVYFLICGVSILVLIFVNKFLINLNYKKESFKIFKKIFKPLVFWNHMKKWLSLRQKGNLSEPFKKIKASIKNYFNFSNFLIIRINLGHDHLKEIDILKLVTKNLLSAYQNRLKITNVYKFGWFILKYFSIYFIFSMLYFQVPFSKINFDVKKNFKIIEYFPSQGITLITNQEKFEKQLKEFNFENNPNSKTKSINDYLDLFASNINGLENEEKVLFKKIPEIYESRDIYDYIRLVTSYIDYYVFFSYQKVIRYIHSIEHRIIGVKQSKISDNYLNNVYTVPIDAKFRLVPNNIDYLFWIYLIGISLILQQALKNNYFNIITSGFIIKKLKILSEKIDNQISSEKSLSAPEKFNSIIGIISRKTKVSEKADVREIETELIEIFDDIQRIPRILKRPEFIIVFDEIDKIEPHKNNSVLDRDEDETMKDNNEAIGTRHRQHNIFKLLSNLKHFLNTAKAKFLFIAGREMYDAALADISDRNFFIGSIFNQVIYVDSFLKDQSDGRNSDITSMIETYVCNYLIPFDFINIEVNDEQYSLKNYAKYLKSLGRNDEKEIKKVINILHYFITYLTYRSNGAPKKIASLFEKFVVAKDKFEISDIDHDEKEPLNSKYILVTRDYNNLYLLFGYTAQYIFGMTSYLINPFFLSINRSINDYTDKLLISSSFIVDHIYKFHRAAFSWKNIEIIPEIVDVNKAPHLRDLISNFIKYLSNTHIQAMNNGLFKFKFIRKIQEEITFVSKKNEQESAAFNFTLDESLGVKKHYQRNLNVLEKKYKSHFMTNGNPEYLQSISYLHATLGDLHFYDQEFDDAVLEYSEAIQLFGLNKFKHLSIESIVTIIRNTLKLGLTYEKKKTFEPAFVIYNKLSTRLIRLKNEPLEQNNNAGNNNNMNMCNDNNNPIIEFYNSNKITEFEYLSNRYNIIETLKLLQQPILAKFFIKEKISPYGITNLDYKQLVIEFFQLFKNNILENNFFIEVDFFSKVGDILFYKNVRQFYFITDLEIKDFDCLTSQGQVYCKTDKSLCLKNDFFDDVVNYGYRVPCNSCNLYMNSIYSLCLHAFFIDLDSEKIKSPLVRKKIFLIGVLNYLAFPGKKQNVEYNIKDENQNIDTYKIFRNVENLDMYKTDYVMKYAGNLLSDTGDTFLSCISTKEKIKKEFIIELVKIVQSDKPVDEKTNLLNDYLNENHVSKLEEIILHYYTSGYYFWRALEFRELYLQYTKILHLIDSYCDLNELNGTDELNQLMEIICRFALHGIFKTYDEINYLEYYDLKTFFEKFSNGDLIIRSNTTLSFEINEIIYLYNRINQKVSLLKLEIDQYVFLGELNDVIYDINTYVEFLINSNQTRSEDNEILIKNKIDRIFDKYDSININQKNNKFIKNILKQFDKFRNIHPKILGKYLELDLWLLVFKSRYSFNNLISPKEFQDAFNIIYSYLIKFNNEINVDSNGIVNSMNNRIMELELKSRTSYYIYILSILNIEVIKNGIKIQNYLPNSELIENTSYLVSLVSDSIFCLYEIIRILNVYGVSFVKNHSTFGYFYEIMGDWCSRIDKLILRSQKSIEDKYNIKKELDINLKLLINEDNMKILNTNYNYQKAMNHYKLALQTHTEGTPYKNVIEDIYILNDDMNENSMHFYCALERYKINSNFILNRIKELSQYSNLYTEYKIKNYVLPQLKILN